MKAKWTVLLGTTAALVLAMAGVAWAQDGCTTACEPPPPPCPDCPTVFEVTKKVPRDGATGVSSTVNVKAFFNHDLRKATVTSTTFKIRRQGTNTWLGATYKVSNALDPTTANRGSESVATLNPNRSLREDATYQVVVTRGVKDTGGDSLDANESWTFTVNECPPDVLNCNPDEEPPPPPS